MELEALKVVAMQGGGVVGVIAVVVLFLRALSKRDENVYKIATTFTESQQQSQTAHQEQVSRLVDDHVSLTKETVRAMGKLDATVRSVERTVLGVEQMVRDLRRPDAPSTATVANREKEQGGGAA